MSDLIKILLVEDNPADARLAKEMIGETACEVELSIARDGEEAIRRIKKSCRENELPHLILLDLKLPRRGGLEVLRFIKSVDYGKTIKVAILTGSLLPEDRVEAISLSVDAYLIKPMSSREFKEISEKIRRLIVSCSSS